MATFFRAVEIKGHLIDSLTLPKILDEILARGGNYEMEEITIGKGRTDQSYARIRITATSPTDLKNIIDRVCQLGALPIGEGE